MKKADPNGVLDSFRVTTSNALADWKSIDLALRSQNLKLRRKAAADAFVSLAVEWEGFVGAWIAAAVNRDASAAIGTLSLRLQKFATSDLRIPTGHLSTSLLSQSHLTLDTVRKMLDPRGFNVVVHDVAELHEYADNWLAGPYEAAARAIGSYDFRPALLTRLIRNALAHQSTSALEEANKCAVLASTPLHLRHLGSRSLDVGGWRRYLLSTTSPVPRVEQLHSDLLLLATKFRVP